MRYQDVVISTRPLVYLPLGDQRNTNGNYRSLGTLSTQAFDDTGSPPSQRGTLGVSMGSSTHWPNPGQNSDRVRIASSTQMNVDTFTVMAWVRRSATGSAMIASRDGSSGVDRFWQWYFSPSNVLQVLNLTDSSIASSSGTITDTQRSHQVAFSIAGTAVSFYIDGGLSGTATLTAISTTGSCAFVAGNVITNSAAHMLGELGHVAYWTRALTLAEVGRLYRAGRNGETF